jgi:hypothetical protein
VDFHALLLRIHMRTVSLVTCFGELFTMFKNLVFIIRDEKNFLYVLAGAI